MATLTDPLTVKNVTLKNRIVMPPMNTDYATTRGTVTDKLIQHYVRCSKDLGLLIIEHSYIAPEGRLSKRQLGIYDDKLIPGLRRLSESIRSAGTPAIIQINHAGRKANKEITGITPVAPSPKRGPKGARGLKKSELDTLIDAFARAADRAMQAGFDGVEIHGAHGFLLNQFYSPIANKRIDDYGGSLENRIRLPLEIVEKVKQKVGNRLLLYRLGSDDLDPRGTNIKDSKKFAERLQEAGVGIINVSGGICGSRPEQLQGTQGYFVKQAHEIKKSVKIPVIGVGGITEPEYADEIVRKGMVDLVAVGRRLIKDPDWATKAIRKLSK